MLEMLDKSPWIPSIEEKNKRKEILQFFKNRNWIIQTNLVKKAFKFSSPKWGYTLKNSNFPIILISITYSNNIYHSNIFLDNKLLIGTTFSHLKNKNLSEYIEELCFEKYL